jgi:hypothetical protein
MYSHGLMSFAADVSGYGDTGTYGVLALAHAALAIPAIFFPQQSAEFLFGSRVLATDGIFVPLFRLLGASLLSGAAKSYILKASPNSIPWARAIAKLCEGNLSGQYLQASTYPKRP